VTGGRRVQSARSLPLSSFSLPSRRDTGVSATPTNNRAGTPRSDSAVWHFSARSAVRETAGRLDASRPESSAVSRAVSPTPPPAPTEASLSLSERANYSPRGSRGLRKVSRATNHRRGSLCFRDGEAVATIARGEAKRIIIELASKNRGQEKRLLPRACHYRERRGIAKTRTAPPQIIDRLPTTRVAPVLLLSRSLNLATGLAGDLAFLSRAFLAESTRHSAAERGGSAVASA